ncbi:MAG TPA: DUF1592 domain-containing protein [Candidatus Acidoferrum sp.]|nr:DUF1592 domain-containing protein [Candidatus Acidoferrum sp.]
MRLAATISALSTLMLLTAPAAHAQKTPSLLTQYCTKCHNSEDWAGKLDMDTLDYDHVDANAETWELMIRKLNAGMMPPKRETQPSAAEVKSFVAQLETQLDSHVKSIAAAPALHRLNRTEYHNAIRDLLALDIDVAALLPQDDAIEGFDNVASGLAISPALIQGYTAAAMKISRAAVGDRTETPGASVYRTAGNLSQTQHLEGLPLGTRGGLKATHNFPLDADYEISVKGGGGFGGFGRDPSTTVVVTLDGKELKLDSTRSFKLTLTAGEHTLTASLRDVKRPTGVNDIYSVYSANGGITSIEINGPLNPTGTGHTASRERVFTCYPKSNDEERGCAEKILVSLGTAGFRTPVTAKDVQPLMAFYDQGRKEGDFETGVQQSVSRLLVDPRFLFRFEEEPANVAPGTEYTISDIELASRLSFFLWSSIPDPELLALAQANKLHEPATLKAQIARMLADRKAQALVDNFAGQWLYLRQLAGATPESAVFDENLRDAFAEETKLLIGAVIGGNRPVTELLDADYTFVNERLATHYGIDGVHGSYFRRIALPADSPRRGLLGQGSILTVTSTASRTSPVVRGSWILQNLLNAPVPSPPAGVERNLDGDGTTKLTTSVRERLEQHRKDPVCGSCHAVIDPVGFSLENFDNIGGWRVKDGDSPVDPRGVLADGTPVQSPTDLRKALLRHSDQFVQTLTQKLMIYALGRPLNYHDMPSVRAILRNAARDDNRFASVVNAIVQSPQFTRRVKQDPVKDAAAGKANTAQR